MAEEFDLLNRRFERAGIEYAVWKGFALIPEYCPDACLRPSYDYDYIISPNAWDGAQQTLLAAGYACRSEPGTRSELTFLPPASLRRLSHAGLGLYSTTIPRKVELHLAP